ncbi:MAG TPA: hypothetical protein VI112_05800 [Bacteroidia bacterium]|jgi:hypothetical protein
MSRTFLLRLAAFITALFCPMLLFAEAPAIDSAQLNAFIQKGRTEFKDLQERNRDHEKKGEFSKVNFVLSLSLDTSANYLHGITVTGKDPFLNTTSLEQNLNSRLRKLYFEDSVECYLILIHYFDIKLTAKIQDSLTAADLFQTGKFFNENSNILALKSAHDSITNSIAHSALSNGRRFIVYSVANYCGAFYNQNKHCYTYWHHGIYNAGNSVSSSAFLDRINDNAVDVIKHTPAFMNGSDEQRAQEMVSALERSAKYSKLESRIMSLYTTDELKEVLSHFTHTTDYLTLTTEERLHILSVFVRETMGGSTQNTVGAETYALRIISSVPNEKTIAFLHGLENESVLNTDPNFSGDKTNHDALIYELVYRIDDHLLNGDNYKQLMIDISNLVMSTENSRREFSQATMANIADRMIYWDAQHFSDPPIGTNSYTVTFNTDGTVKYKREVVDYLIEDNEGTAPHWDAYADVTVHPFDILVFVNKSNASMIAAAGAQPGEMNFMPAVFLKYAKDKEFNQTALTTSCTVIDIATLITGPGLIYKAARLGKLAVGLFEAANTLAAGVNLSVNMLNIQDPDVKAVVADFNLIVGAWGLGRLGYSGVLKINNTLSALLDDSKSITTISIDDARRYLRDFATAEDKIKDLEGVLPADKDMLAQMKKLLEARVGSYFDLGNLLSLRQKWLDDLKSLYGNLDYEGFLTNGIDPNTIPIDLINDMLNEYSNTLSPQQKQNLLNSLLKSGSDIPVKRILNSGEELYKIVSKGKLPGRSSYYMTKTQFEQLENSIDIENKLGLPLGSLSVEYDVYVATAKEQVTIFESTVAPTIQRGYQTSGGATQTLILNTEKWTITKLKTIIPPR